MLLGFDFFYPLRAEREQKTKELHQRFTFQNCIYLPTAPWKDNKKRGGWVVGGGEVAMIS